MNISNNDFIEKKEIKQEEITIEIKDTEEKKNKENVIEIKDDNKNQIVAGNLYEKDCYFYIKKITENDNYQTFFCGHCVCQECLSKFRDTYKNFIEDEQKNDMESDVNICPKCWFYSQSILVI